MKEGDRIVLDHMADEPDPIPVGTEGTVRFISKLGDWTQVDVEWENGRNLMLSIPPDRAHVIPRKGVA